MRYKVAFATSDGIVVNQHFGHAEQFLVAEILEDKKTWKVIETRTGRPVCAGGNHEEGALEQTARLLSDCRLVVVQKIGPGAAQLLETHGVHSLESACMIGELLNRLSADRQTRIRLGVR